MNGILITGSTGNIGLAVLKALQPFSGSLDIRAGVRSLKDSTLISALGAEPVMFDFEDQDTFTDALTGVNQLFLLRPPQLANVDKYFRPLILAAGKAGVKTVVFLSVQGAENNKRIPHHKIEQMILESGLDHVFLRPAYFMQNFISTLKDELVRNNRIYLPAGKAKFTLVDTTDIGLVAAQILRNPAPHIGKAYALTNDELLSFGEMADQLSEGLGRNIRFSSPDPVSFLLNRTMKGEPLMMSLVMVMLHFLPRFQPPPETTDWVKKITGLEPQSFATFIQENREKMTANA